MKLKLIYNFNYTLQLQITQKRKRGKPRTPYKVEKRKSMFVENLERGQCSEQNGASECATSRCVMMITICCNIRIFRFHCIIGGHNKIP